MPLAEARIREIFKLSPEQGLDTALRRACAKFGQPVLAFISTSDYFAMVKQLCETIGPEGMLRTSSEGHTALNYALKNLLDCPGNETIVDLSEGGPEGAQYRHLGQTLGDKLKLVVLIAQYTPTPGLTPAFAKEYKQDPSFTTEEAVLADLRRERQTISHRELSRRAALLSLQLAARSKQPSFDQRLIASLPALILLHRTESSPDLDTFFAEHTATFARGGYQTVHIQPFFNFNQNEDGFRNNLAEIADLKAKFGQHLIFRLLYIYATADEAQAPLYAALEQMYDYESVLKPINALLEVISTLEAAQHAHKGAMIVTNPFYRPEMIEACRTLGVEPREIALTTDQDVRLAATAGNRQRAPSP